MNRTSILDALISEQEKVVNSAKQSVDRYKTASDLDEDSTLDPEDYSHQTEAKDMQLRFQVLLNEAKYNMEFLQEELEKEHQEVEAGAILDLGDMAIFIGFSIPKFDLDGKSILAISVDTPLYKDLKNKKVGDTVQFNGEDRTIKSIA